MAKYLEICLFISIKALKCVMVLEKAIKLYLWASQGGLVGLSAWPGFGVAAWQGTVFISQRSAVWTLAPHSWVSAVAVGILGIGVSESRLALSDIENGLLGVLDAVAGLCYGGLPTSIGIPIRLSRLRETIIQTDNAGAIL